MIELLKKIQKVSNTLKAIEKDMKVGNSNYGYKAVSDYSVVLKVKEAEKAAGIISIPIEQELVSSEVLRTNKKDRNSSESTEAITYVDVVKMKLRIYDLSNEGSFIDVISYARGLDSGDKGFGKAATYARKYALLNAYKITTGEDPDAEMSKKETIISTDDKKVKVLDYISANNEYAVNLFQHFGIESASDLTDSQIKMTYTNLTQKGRI